MNPFGAVRPAVPRSLWMHDLTERPASSNRSGSSLSDVYSAAVPNIGILSRSNGFNESSPLVISCRGSHKMLTATRINDQ